MEREARRASSTRATRMPALQRRLAPSSWRAAKRWGAARFGCAIGFTMTDAKWRTPVVASTARSLPRQSPNRAAQTLFAREDGPKSAALLSFLNDPQRLKKAGALPRLVEMITVAVANQTAASARLASAIARLISAMALAVRRAVASLSSASICALIAVIS